MQTTAIRSFLIWVIGALLIIGGALVLVTSTGLLGYGGPTLPLMAGVVALLALPFVARWLINREEWWALVVGWVFVAIAIWLMVLFIEPIYSQLILITALVEVAIPFGVVYLLDRKRWWAIILSYALVALGGLLALTIFVDSRDIIGAFGLLAVALPFWLAYLTNRQLTWALISAGILSIVGAGVLLYVTIVRPAGSAGFYVILNATLAIVSLAIWITNRRFDWSLWITVGFVGAAVAAYWLPSLASWAVVALAAGSYLISRQIKAGSPTAPKQPASQPQPQQAPSPAQQPAPPPAPAAPPAPTPPPAPSAPPAPAPGPGQGTDAAAAAAREARERPPAENQPLTGFRPINPFDVQKSDEEDED
jgi:hypothetical protein